MVIACTSPTITLIPSTSTFHSPIQFRRSQDFYLSATIQFNCNDSLPFQMQWFIINCTSSSCIHPIQVDASIITTFPDLYMPSRTLPLGLFQLKFVVTVNNSFTSMSAYVQINPSGITANLVRLGTSMITTGYDQNLQLNPGLYSIDTDGYPFNASVNLFLFQFIDILSFHLRIGNTLIFVESMAYRVFHTFEVFFFRSMIHPFHFPMLHASIHR